MPFGVYGFNPQWLVLMLASAALGLITQGFINSSFRKWSRVAVSSGMTGAQVAQAVLRANGLDGVEVRQIGGTLSDNYDPRTRVLNLSQGVYGVASVAAAGVAAHEAGHAVQHATGYVWGSVRSALVPAANIGSQLSWVLILMGFWIQLTGLIWAGILFYSMAVAFQVVTLPVEFDASRRALASLQSTNVVDAQQLVGARQVLTAAALTYVAAALIAVMQLLYLIGLGRRD